MRQRHGRGFVYREPGGRLVRDEATLARIRALVIPPAWSEVWIARAANAHLQATGRDARGRKQYRYHARWAAHRSETKYTRLLAFAAVLPLVRQRTERDLAEADLSRRKVAALVVRLLEKTLIRVGNDEYARVNGSYGLTTMRDRHVTVRGHEVSFTFVGKSGKPQSVAVADRRLARLVRRCQDLPGQELFQYVDASGARQALGSADINEYLREVSGGDFTAKDFRTWAGTLLAAQALRDLPAPTSMAAAKRNVVAALDSVSSRLGNTKAVCRSSYVHPVIVEAYHEGVTLDAHTVSVRSTRGTLSRDERALVRLLARRLQQAA